MVDKDTRIAQVGGSYSTQSQTKEVQDQLVVKQAVDEFCNVQLVKSKGGNTSS